MFEIPDVTYVPMDSLADVLLGTALATAALWWCVKTLVRRTAQPTHAEEVPRKTVVNSEQRRRSKRRLYPGDIGSRCNNWKKPKAFFGPGEKEMEKQLCKAFDLVDFDIHRADWIESTNINNKVIVMLLTEVKIEADRYRLNVEKLVRQGSAREGLKVCVPDEFDVLVQFAIEGMQLKVKLERDSNGRTLPEIGKLRVVYPAVIFLRSYYPKLSDAGVFHVENEHVYLNSKILHERVFTAIIDKAGKCVTRMLKTEKCPFRILRAINPPAIKITTEFEIDKYDGVDISDHVSDVFWKYKAVVASAIGESTAGAEGHVYKVRTDIDFVPALLLVNDQVPDPTDNQATMDCPRYAVFKWVHEASNHPFTKVSGVNPETIWWMDSSGYEKHVLDTAQGSDEQRYILTAVRVLKAYFMYEKTKKPPLQIAAVMRSYFFKQLGFYCILYYRVLHNVPLSGVKEVLTILLDMLEICLTEKRLPHFFHTNPWLSYMFPDYSSDDRSLRYNLFNTIPKDALWQARLDMRRYVKGALSDFTCHMKPDVCNIQGKFQEFVSHGNYHGDSSSAEEE